MKLESIHVGSTDALLVRLFDFDKEQAFRLLAIFTGLAEDSIHSLDLHDADFIETLGNCRLTLNVASRDQGLVKTAEPATFDCSLTPETWDNVEGLTEPFTQIDAQGFQWLNDAAIPLLLSCDGHW